MVMLLVTELLRWWYGDGWRGRAQRISVRLDGTIDYFSIGLLAKTLFAPFRQISAGKVNGPIGVQMRALVDKLVSRVIGALVRMIILIVGGIAIGLQVAVSGVILLAWGLVPLLPVVGIILAVMGVSF